MKARTGIEFLVCLSLAASVTRAADTRSTAPARVEGAVSESDLVTLKLTAQAEQRLGIELVEAVRKKVPVSRDFGGDVLIPFAPEGAAPTNYFPLGASTPDELLRLSDQQAVADGESEKARVQLDAAQRTHRRAQKLIQDEAGSLRAVEDAEAQVRLAEKAFEVASSRRALLGTPVSEAIRDPRFWVRVPVYAGELKLIDVSQEARVGDVAWRLGEANFPARPVSAPPSASPLTATVDLFYEITRAGSAFRPGQRVRVSVPMRGEEESLVVPWAAILIDIHGNAWVYERLSPQTFTRRRVQVARIVGRDAVLASGPKPGSKIITAGAAELFGTEFGGGK